jgi:cell wall-associated NlpC family hydrolase
MLPVTEIPKLTAKMNAGYRLGAKAKYLGQQLAEIDEIDCSGFVRIIWFKVFDNVIPDGSWHQNNWLVQKGYKPGKKLDCFKKDGKLRILYMAPKGKKPGHIAFCLNGRTYESYGGNGPGSRLFTGLSPFQAKAIVWEIA